MNVGVFVTGALLLDFVLWLFILLGWESVNIPEDFSDTHQPHFVFPYSHGLLAAGGWSALAGALVLCLYSRLKEAKWRAAVLVAREDGAVSASIPKALLDFAFCHRLGIDIRDLRRLFRKCFGLALRRR